MSLLSGISGRKKKRGKKEKGGGREGKEGRGVWKPEEPAHGRPRFFSILLLRAEVPKKKKEKKGKSRKKGTKDLAVEACVLAPKIITFSSMLPSVVGGGERGKERRKEEGSSPSTARGQERLPLLFHHAFSDEGEKKKKREGRGGKESKAQSERGENAWSRAPRNGVHRATPLHPFITAVVRLRSGKKKKRWEVGLVRRLLCLLLFPQRIPYAIAKKERGKGRRKGVGMDAAIALAEMITSNGLCHLQPLKRIIKKKKRRKGGGGN